MPTRLRGKMTKIHMQATAIYSDGNPNITVLLYLTRVVFVDGVTSQSVMSVDGEEIPG